MKQIRWFLTNLIPLAVLVGGQYFNNTGMTNIALFLTVLAFFSSLFLLNEKVVDDLTEKGFAVSKEVDFYYDIMFLMVLVYLGHFFIAVLWFIHTSIVMVARTDWEKRQVALLKLEREELEREEVEREEVEKAKRKSIKRQRKEATI